MPTEQENDQERMAAKARIRPEIVEAVKSATKGKPIEPVHVVGRDNETQETYGAFAYIGNKDRTPQITVTEVGFLPRGKSLESAVRKTAALSPEIPLVCTAEVAASLGPVTREKSGQFYVTLSDGTRVKILSPNA